MKYLSILAPLLLSFSIIAEHRINFALYRSENAVEMFRKFQPLIQEIQELYSKELQQKVKINFKIYPDYEEAHKALLKGEVDFARVGPASYLLLKKKNKKVDILACEEKNGQLSFDAVAVTHKNSTITKLHQAQKKKVAFGNKFSTIGRYWAQALLIESKIHANNLQKYSYLGRHDKVVMAILTQKYDIGFLKGSIYRKYDKNKKLLILAQSQIPNKPWICSPQLSLKTKKDLRKILLSIKNSKSLRRLKLTGFKEVKHKFYAPIQKYIDSSIYFEEAE